MRVDLPRQPGAMASPPTRLSTAPAVSVATDATVRTFNLNGGMMGSPFTINGRRFDIDRIDLAVPAGAVEIWRFVNATGMAHPMHVHGVRMSLLSRDGSPAGRSRARSAGYLHRGRDADRQRCRTDTACGVIGTQSCSIATSSNTRTPA
jgi:FtsP/CotA-like multicopper oxidase with cupredoxin domain